MQQEDHIEREIRELDEFTKELMAQLSDEGVIQKLIKEKGLKENYARAVIHSIHERKENRKNFWRSVLMGGSAVLGSGLMTTISYGISESAGGNTFLIFYGIMAFGVITILRGFVLYR